MSYGTMLKRDIFSPENLEVGCGRAQLLRNSDRISCTRTARAAFGHIHGAQRRRAELGKMDPDLLSVQKRQCGESSQTIPEDPETLFVPRATERHC